MPSPPPSTPREEAPGAPALRTEHARPRGLRVRARLLLVAIGVLLPVLAAEIALRFALPADSLVVGQEIDVFRRNIDSVRGVLQPDAELGYAPLLEGLRFDAWGTHRNHYPRTRQPGVTRVLFLGDSVTGRARVMHALAHLVPSDAFEFWNAGVEGWNTEQEVAFFFRVNHRVQPDRVVLGFHSNDFRNTPIGFRDDDGNLVVYQTRHPLRISPGLYATSYLYRLWVRWRTEDDGKVDYEQFAPRVEASLRRLRDGLQANGIPLTILLYPIFATTDVWSRDERLSRQLSIEIFERLGLHWIDLAEPIAELTKASAPVEEKAGDRWHPNDLAATRMAEFALEAGVLGPVPARPDLISDRPTVSATGEEIQTLTVDCGPAMAGAPYVVVGSCSGTSPGINLGRFHIALNIDAYTIATVTGSSESLDGGRGTLDDQGRATVAVSLDAARRRALAGSTVHHACLVVAPDGAQLRRVTRAVALSIAR